MLKCTYSNFFILTGDILSLLRLGAGSGAGTSIGCLPYSPPGIELTTFFVLGPALQPTEPHQPGPPILFRPRFQLPLNAVQTTQTEQLFLSPYSQVTFSTTATDTDWSLCNLQVKVTPLSFSLMEDTQIELELILFPAFKSTDPCSRYQRSPSSPVGLWTSHLRDSSAPRQVFRMKFSVLPLSLIHISEPTRLSW